MKFNSKTFRKNYFILYDLNDEIICYIDNFNELSKHINYDICHIVWLFNRDNTDIITIMYDGVKHKLATFC